MNNNQLGNSTELPPFNPNFGNDTNAPDGIQQFMNNEQRERGNNHFGQQKNDFYNNNFPMNVPNNNQNRSSFNNSNVMPNGPMMDDTNMFGPNQNCPFGGNQNMPNGMGFPGNNTQRMDQN